MIKYCLMFLFLGLMSCRVKHVPDPKEAKETAAKKDSIDNRAYRENRRIEFLQRIGEPDLIASRREAFRFLYNTQYGDYIILTVVSQRNLDSVASPGRWPNEADLVCKLVYGERASDSSKQLLSEKEYAEFKMILNGTYYWMMANKDCWDGVIRDGKTAEFEGMSYTCPVDSLTYTSVNLAPFYNGSFKEAFRYLIKKAELFKRNADFQKAILKY